MNSSSSSLEYFEFLRRCSLGVLDTLGLQSEPLPLDTILGQLQPKLDNSEAYLLSFGAVPKPEPANARVPISSGVGLNSVGMLVDRLTILFIREWCLINKGRPNPEKAQAIYDQQTRDIMIALSEARPGSSALNSKLTHLKGEAKATNWLQAYYGLFATNVLLWEAQEILYTRDIRQLPPEELRSYITWFAYGNMRRNEYIQMCEEYYWRS